MFRGKYQNGSHIMLLEAKGPDSLGKWAQRKVGTPSIEKAFDKTVRTYVCNVNGGVGTKMTLPKKGSLALRQPMLTFQLLIPRGKAFSFDLAILDTQKARRRIHFSSAFRVVKRSPLAAHLPLHIVSGTC
ncbi:uncharacterised protein C3orf67 [Kipferlia bialata]|uniref:CFA20 domain-containing protein n=1 Tax=Kipferlia bialata TaxID=797122 RepID=A0A9K3D3L2_9EUKA|nr:uncharacterised protein C3orf67 [Kipferlia bialata]|eukprot:g8947.t1